MKNDSIIIAGYYGFGNAGDELILYSLIRKFRRENPDIAITVLSNRASLTSREWKVGAVDRWRPWRWIVPLIRADGFVLGGGGLLQESTGPWNHLYYLGLVVAAKLCGCQTEVIAIGVDPIQGSLNRFWTRWVLNLWTDQLSVRDAASRQALLEGGVLAPIEISPDPVVELSCPPAESGGGRGIALALSPQPGRPEWGEEAAELCQKVNERLQTPIDLLVFFPAEDGALAADIARRSSAIRSVRVWGNPLDVLSWIPQYQLVIGTRFHALVLAANGKIPFIGWGSQQKVRSLCSRLQNPYWDGKGNWSLQSRLEQIIRLYQSAEKSDILATRID